MGGIRRQGRQVSSIFVGWVKTVWAGEITPPQSKRSKVTSYATADNVVQLESGKELGRFNMGGSIIIVLFGHSHVAWQAELVPEARIRFGQELGVVA